MAEFKEKVFLKAVENGVGLLTASAGLGWLAFNIGARPESHRLITELSNAQLASGAKYTAIALTIGALIGWLNDPRPSDIRGDVITKRDRPKVPNPIRELREEVMKTISDGLDGQSERFVLQDSVALYLSTSKDKYGHQNYDASWMLEPKTAFRLRLRYITPRAHVRTYTLDSRIQPTDFYQHLDTSPNSDTVPNEELLKNLRDRIRVWAPPTPKDRSW